MGTHPDYLRWLASEIDAGRVATDVPAPAPPPQAAAAAPLPLGVPIPPNWSLKFREEFDGPIDVAEKGVAKWTDHLWYISSYKQDRNHYPTGDATVPLASVFPCSNSLLTLTAKKLADGWVGSCLCTVNSQGVGFSQKYGYFEGRMKLPKGHGMWPAFWLYNVAKVTNAAAPASELDIHEYLGLYPNTYWAHWHSYATGTHLFNGGTARRDFPFDLSLDFHTWGLMWNTNKLVWYLDGKPVLDESAAMTKPDLNVPMFLILNLAIGGWGGNVVDSTTPNPSTMLVDYVRAWGP